MERDGKLNQALQEFLCLSRGSAPNIFQHLVSVKEFLLVKQSNAASVSVEVELIITSHDHMALREEASCARLPSRGGLGLRDFVLIQNS